MLAQIDEQLSRIEGRLAGYEQLLTERKRLLAARAALSGQTASGGRRITQEDLATYLQKHPGSLPAQIAKDLEVPVTNVSQHLYRGKGTRFIRSHDGWHPRR